MIALARVGIGLFFSFAGVISAAEVTPPVTRLMVFLPQGVDWIALPVEGHDLLAARAEFSRRVFVSRDSDQNGTLSSTEAVQLLVWSPEQGRLRLLGKEWTSADTMPQDGSLALIEWQAFTERSFGQQFRIVVDNRGSKRAGVLFSLVDQDQDGRLTATELEEGSARLLRCDFDDDELITLSELAELRLAGDQNAATPFETDPFLLLQGDVSIQTGVNEIVSRFGEPGAAGVTVARIAGCDANSDRDADGLLNPHELTEILKHPPTTGQLRITLKGAKGGLRWFAAGEDSSSASTRRRDPVELENLVFDAKYLNTELLDQLQRQELMAQFGDADNDNNDYLSATEFAEFASVLDAKLAPDPAMADINGNNQITREEVTLFNELRELASRCQIQLTVQRELKSLFDALDQDHNRGVSGWEIRSGSAQMSALDRNQDGSVTVTELTEAGNLSLHVGFASTRRDETTTTPVRNRNQNLPRRPSGQGPIWFQRMDRNQDHRVSWREFLGSREQFQSLDQNQDGSIAVSEVQL